MSSKATYHLIFHGLIAIIYFSVIVKLLNAPPLPRIDPFAGFFKFFTFWNLLVQFLFFTFSCIGDLMNYNDNNKIARLRDTLFASMVASPALFVTLTFWTLYGIDRDLILPEDYAAIFPPWVNHTAHSLITPVVLIEMFIQKHRYPERKYGLSIKIIFTLIYTAWILYLGLCMDIWVYPIFKVLNSIQRTLFIVSCILFDISLYFVCEKINGYFWGKNKAQKSKQG